MRITATVTGRAGKFAQTPLVNAKLMRAIGDLALSLIRRRTAAGRDANGAAFRPLSPAYAAKKQEELGTSDANLTVSGRMLNEMQQIAVTEKTVTIGFGAGEVASGGASGGTFIQRSRAVSGAAKARFHQVDGAGTSRVKRKFFGLTREERQQIVDRVEAHAKRAFRTGQQE